MEYKLIGYIFNSEGKYLNKIFLRKTPSNIARFIARGLNSSELLITDIFDEMFLRVIDGDLEYYDDDFNFYNELKLNLMSFLTGETNPFDGKVIYTFGSVDGIHEDLERNSRILKSLRDDFNYIL